MNGAVCPHCGEPSPDALFCCTGCKAAYELIRELGLGRYYDTRIFSAEASSLKPDEGTERDFTPFIDTDPKGLHTLYLMAEGLHCAACVWLIETALNKQEDVVLARLNMSTRRLTLTWRGKPRYGNRLVHLIERMGYHLKPFDPELLRTVSAKEEKFLLLCVAIAGFASGNIMLLSFALWFSTGESMGIATRTLLHWVSALIALPTVLYAGTPFFHSAFAALKARRTNMDVPISIALLLTIGMSLFETLRMGEHVYFDSVVMLLFLLLVGRYLDRRARGQARQAAERLLMLQAASTTMIEKGKRRIIAVRNLRPGMIILTAAGERVAADGIIVQGQSDVDASLITGESIPRPVTKNAAIFAGTLNLTAPLHVRITATPGKTLLDDIMRLMEQAEQNKSQYVRFADRVARLYTPVVHSLALLTFIGWLMMGMAWQPALLIAVTVLIITCPCALGLAVPAVQVIASGRLMQQGILLKSGDALERMHGIDTIAFDKTGTLTLGTLELLHKEQYKTADLQRAAALAAGSKHPLAQAIARSYSGKMLALSIKEHPGQGLSTIYKGQPMRLGSRVWCGDTRARESGMPELWLRYGKAKPICFQFQDRLRPDAAQVIEELKRRGLAIVMLSGDREAVVSTIAQKTGITEWHANLTPLEKVQFLKYKKRMMMVGDGLNDAPALTAASVSMSPSQAADIAQNAADVIFQGEKLAPVLEALRVAEHSQHLVKQNVALAIIYNSIAVPLAMSGLVTPLIAAAAMSASSLAVIMNALRLNRK